MPLGTVLIIALALVWAAVLLPSLFRSRFSSSPISGVRSFEQAMGVLAGARSKRAASQASSGRWIMVPRSDVTAPVRRRARVVRRRRKNFARLLVAVVMALALSFVPGLRWMLFVFGALDLGFGFYVWQLRRWKTAEVARRGGDISLDGQPADAEPAVAELARQTG